MIEPGEPGEQGGRRRLPAVDQGAASQFIISFRRRSHVVIQSFPGGCPTCQPPSSPTIGAMISAQLHLPGDCVIIYDGRQR